MNTVNRSRRSKTEGCNAECEEEKNVTVRAYESILEWVWTAVLASVVMGITVSAGVYTLRGIPKQRRRRTNGTNRGTMEDDRTRDWSVAGHVKQR